jgi:hypothetical protein
LVFFVAAAFGAVVVVDALVEDAATGTWSCFIFALVTELLVTELFVDFASDLSNCAEGCVFLFSAAGCFAWIAGLVTSALAGLALRDFGLSLSPVTGLGFDGSSASFSTG